MIATELIEEIRSKADIVAVVSEQVKLRKTGRNYVGLCPFHPERTPSFTVSPEKQLFHCFGCGEGGNIFAFMMKSENIGFAEAVREVGEKIGIVVAKPAGTPSGISKSEKDRLLEVVSLAQKFFVSQLPLAADYLTRRGISQDTARTFGLGCAPEGWDNLFKHLLSRGVSPVLIEKAGLTLPRENKDGYYDRFRSRLIFPIFDLRGRPIAFSGRSLKDEEPKYMNSPETPIYHKGESIFGLYLTKDEIKKEKTAVLVEGNIDLVSVYQAGIRNVAAPLGTALTVAQGKLLARFAETVILAFDADSAGESAAARSVELLRSQGLRVKVVEFTGAKDPDELIKKQGAEGFKKALAASLSFLEFKLKRALAKYRLTEIEDRARALRDVVAILSTEPDDFVQKEYTRLIAAQLRVDQETITAEIKRSGFYRPGAVRDMRRITEKPLSKVAEAEKQLILLALHDPVYLQQFKQSLQLEDFRLPETKALAEVVLLTDLEHQSNPVHFLLENIPDERIGNYLSSILVGEVPHEAAKVFADCLATLRDEGFREKIKGLKAEFQAAEQAGEAEKAAALLVLLKDEISLEGTR